MASRKPLAPHVIAYWLTSAAMASWAALLTESGAGKSGKPCARLIAPCAIARRVISRMTDSVNDAALPETAIGRAVMPAPLCYGRLPPRHEGGATGRPHRTARLAP